MQTIDQIRRARLEILIKEFGSVKALADRLDRTPGQVSQWRNASIDSKSGKPRNIGTAAARFIEKACGKDSGWLDAPTAPAAKEEEGMVLTETQRLLLSAAEPLAGRQLARLIQAADWIAEGREIMAGDPPNKKPSAAAEKSAKRMSQ